MLKKRKKRSLQSFSSLIHTKVRKSNTNNVKQTQTLKSKT